MKTLVIHPDDRSTDFLKPVYQNLKNITIITNDVDLKLHSTNLNELISKHDRVLMMGHGTSQGLFGVQAFSSFYIVNSDNVEALSEKTENVFVWCNADKFVNYYKLKGLFTGMFISEVGEALMFDIRAKQSIVDESNNQFAQRLGSVLDQPITKSYRILYEDYTTLAHTNSVAAFNSKRLFLTQ